MAIDPVYEERSVEEMLESAEVENEDTLKFLAKNDYGFFLEHVLGLNTDSELIQEAVGLVNEPPQQPGDATKIAVMAPRGHSKTYSYTVGRALYVAFTEQGKRIILTSASNTQSKSIMKKIKRIIERNELLGYLKPGNLEDFESSMLQEDEDSWAATQIATTSDVVMTTKTFGSSIRSEHVDYVFCDDILQDSKGNRTTEQEKDTFYNVISPIIENKGGVLQVVGTPQDHDDLMMELMGKEAYYSTEYQAYDPETGQPLWPWNWSYEGLMRKKDEVGPARFAREYMCDPMSVDEQFFSWEEAVKPNLEKNRSGEAWRSVDISSDWTFYLGVDIALSGSDDADFSVFVVLGKDPDGQTWLVDLQREKGMTPQGIASRITELDELYRFSRGKVEKNAIGEGVWRTIKKESSLSGRIQSFDTTRKSRPRILSSLQAALHRGDLVLHHHDTLIDEMLAFQNRGGKLSGKAHDDTVMSLAIAWDCVEDDDATAYGGGIIGADVEDDGEEFSLENDVSDEEQELAEMGII